MHYVLLPGLHGSAHLFDAFVAAAPPGSSFTSVAYPRSGPQDYNALTAVARGALPRNRPYVLVAESFSGPIAVWLAAERPPRLVELVLVATFVVAPVPRALAKAPDWAYRLLPMRTRLPRIALAGLRRGRFDAVLAAELASVKRAVFRDRVRAILGVDVRAELRAVSVPVKYLQATRDWTVLAKAARVIQSARPDLPVLRVPGPHLLLQCAPRKAWAAMAAT